MNIPGVFKNAKEVREISAGTVIFDVGDAGAEMFGVIEGEVEIRLPSGSTRQLAADDTFGEMSMVDSSPRSATAVAISDIKLAVIDRHTFLFLVHETPAFALQVMSTIAERLRAKD